MPGKDGTGPRGLNAATGRGWGWRFGAGRRRASGAGAGHGWRHGFYGTGLAGTATKPELATLRQQAAELERALGALTSRIQEMEELEASARSSSGTD